MSQSKDISYHSILKATGVFGVMQIIKLLISMISSKFIAVFIGPIGIGVVSLLNNAVNIILAITNFEFLKTATREVALNHDSSNTIKLSKTIATLQKMAIFIGLLGAIISLLFSKTLSYYTFGSYNKQHWFVILSLYFLLTSFSNARLSILQGINNINALAWSTIVIAFFTSIGSVIIYYFLRFEGIIWSMLYSSFVLLFFTIYFTRKFSFSLQSIDFNEFYESSSPIFKLGFFMSLNLIFGQIVNFIIKLYINNNGESSQILGFY
uniref:oligosaccharide flippase family protein n=1 Tax=Flavobacterium sp. TaxID=239 RepID=UPI00375378C9